MKQKMKSIIFYLTVIFLITSCQSVDGKKDTETWKQEILETEADFEKMVEEKGIPYAFRFYADNDAVLLRNNKLIKGKKAISESYGDRMNSDSIRLTWEPDFVEVSQSGDMAYTYGEYIYTIIDSTGKETSSEGIFHTVWKRQENGSWKYVWD